MAATWKSLRGMVKVKDGDAEKLILVRRGEKLPDGLADGELERLRRTNAIDEGKSSKAAAPAEEPKAAETSDLANLNDEQLAELYKSKPPLVKDITEAVGDNAELAARFLAAEKAAMKGDARSTVVSQLEKVAAAAPAEEPKA